MRRANPTAGLRDYSTHTCRGQCTGRGGASGRGTGRRSVARKRQTAGSMEGEGGPRRKPERDAGPSSVAASLPSRPLINERYGTVKALLTRRCMLQTGSGAGQRVPGARGHVAGWAARPGITLMQETPDTGANRRRFERVAVPFTEAQATHVAAHRAARFRVRIADLSAGGAKLLTPRPLNPDDALYVHLPGPEHGGALAVPSRVVWAHQGDSGWQIGVESIKVPTLGEPAPPEGTAMQAVHEALAGLLQAARQSGDATVLREGVRVLRAALAALETGGDGLGPGTEALVEPGGRDASTVAGYQNAAFARAVLVPGISAEPGSEQTAEAQERLARALVPLVQAAYEQSRIPWPGDITVILERLRGAGLYIPRISHRA